MNENNSSDLTKNHNEILEDEFDEMNTKPSITPTHLSKKKKRIKVKAWCGECFQFFENGPFAKVCREHLTKGKCNLVECTKKLINEDGVNCTRKFPNINSENRHTYCLTEEEVKDWDEKIKIQNCLGIKRNADRNYEKNKINHISSHTQNGSHNDQSPMKIMNKNYFCTFKDKDKDSKDKEKDNKSSKSSDNNKLNGKLGIDGHYGFDLNFENLFAHNNNQNYVFNLIDEINNLNFVEGENQSLDDRLINEFNNIYFGSGEKIEVEKLNKSENSENAVTIEKLRKSEKDHILNGDNNLIEIEHNFIQIKEENKENNILKDDKIKLAIDNTLSQENTENKKNENQGQIHMQTNFVNNNINISSKTNIISSMEIPDVIKDEEKIDTIFEKIHYSSKIPKSVLNKIKSAFKKKGILTVKILRLYKEKKKSWDFLIDNFKNVCSQIEGVALCIENILDAN